MAGPAGTLAPLLTIGRPRGTVPTVDPIARGSPTHAAHGALLLDAARRGGTTHRLWRRPAGGVVGRCPAGAHRRAGSPAAPGARHGSVQRADRAGGRAAD